MAVNGHDQGIVGSMHRRCILQFIILEQNLRDGLDLVDRTGYTSSDGMYLVEQTDLVEQPGYVDRTGEASS